LRKAAYFYELADLELELGRARLARGILLKERGRLPQARKELSAALEVFRGTSSIDEARANNELAAVERESGNADAALGLADAAIDLGPHVNQGELARSHRERGLALAISDVPTAKRSLEVAIDLFTRAEERVEAALTHAYLGDLLAPKNQKQAMVAYRQGLAIFEAQR
jgi:tetratricopeptide (TPR) repeat protein